MLRTPILYNTGFFSAAANDQIRAAQHLLPQDLASYCYMPPRLPAPADFRCGGACWRPITFPYPQASPPLQECPLYKLNTRFTYES